MNGENERKNLNLTISILHLSGLSIYFGFPFGHILCPILIWIVNLNNHSDIHLHFKKAINFQFSITLIGIIFGVVLSFHPFLAAINSFVIFILCFIHAGYTIYACLESYKGSKKLYPSFTIPIVPGNLFRIGDDSTYKYSKLLQKICVLISLLIIIAGIILGIFFFENYIGEKTALVIFDIKLGFWPYSSLSIILFMVNFTIYIYIFRENKFTGTMYYIKKALFYIWFLMILIIFGHLSIFWIISIHGYELILGPLFGYP